MKTICAIAFILITSFTAIPNKPVDKVDLDKFAGKWYSLYSIPTAFDKGSRETTTTYTWNAKKDYYDVLTVCKKDGDADLHTYRSKLFHVQNTNNAEMKAQFLWPFKVDYLVITLADDYSYAVVGHPEHKFLFIISRKPAISKKLMMSLLPDAKL